MIGFANLGEINYKVGILEIAMTDPSQGSESEKLSPAEALGRKGCPICGGSGFMPRPIEEHDTYGQRARKIRCTCLKDA